MLGGREFLKKMMLGKLLKTALFQRRRKKTLKVGSFLNLLLSILVGQFLLLLGSFAINFHLFDWPETIPLFI